MDYKLDEIRGHAFFNGLEDTTLQELLASALMSRFPQHAALVSEGERSDFLYVLFEGTAAASSIYQERETTLFLLRPGAAFPLSAVVRSEIPLSTIKTQDNCRILLLPADPTRALLKTDNAFCLSVLNTMARNSRNKTREIKNLKLRTSAERLANWIYEMLRRTPKLRRLEISTGKRTLAMRLGMTPESLSRGFAQLGEYGIRVEGRTIWVQDPGALQRFAAPTPFIDEAQ